jgi:predicted component of type VI protein secretion system
MGKPTIIISAQSPEEFLDLTILDMIEKNPEMVIPQTPLLPTKIKQRHEILKLKSKQIDKSSAKNLLADLQRSMTESKNEMRKLKKSISILNSKKDPTSARKFEPFSS